MRPNANSTSKSRSCATKCPACGASSESLSKTPCGCDIAWNTSMPYPSWPFRRVRGTELMKLQRQMKAQPPIEEEALL